MLLLVVSSRLARLLRGTAIGMKIQKVGPPGSVCSSLLTSSVSLHVISGGDSSLCLPWSSLTAHIRGWLQPCIRYDHVLIVQKSLSFSVSLTMTEDGRLVSCLWMELRLCYLLLFLVGLTNTSISPGPGLSRNKFLSFFADETHSQKKKKKMVITVIAAQFVCLHLTHNLWSFPSSPGFQ